MAHEKWLVSWIGESDLAAFESGENKGVGPVANALLLHAKFDRVFLLTNYAYQRSVDYCTWLQDRTGYESSTVDLQEIELEDRNPTNYASIYEEVCKHLKSLRLPQDDIDLTFHLSPGTGAMGAIWILLAKTRFPAKLIQTSAQRGLDSVNFWFDLANDFLPEFYQQRSNRIERLVRGPEVAAPSFGKILHKSDVVKAVIEKAQRLAPLDSTVLILGETGTGKELFANAIHSASGRGGKIVPVNCGAIAPELVNSTLFGHVKGAFTGAIKDHKGFFRDADDGTIFLDEIGELSLDSQVRLLRVLQEKEVTPLGGTVPVKVNVRIVAATHRDLPAEVAAGRFREDLFQRLAYGVLRLPPLRDREGDVELLLDAFMTQINQESRNQPGFCDKKLSESAKKILMAYSWPGNVRELYNTLGRAAINTLEEEITAEVIEDSLIRIERKSDGVLGRPITSGFNLQSVLDEVSQDYIKRALIQTGNRKQSAADLLGLTHQQTLSNWVKNIERRKAAR